MISSTSNPLVKNIVRLQQQAGHRREAGRFCLELDRELSRALEGGFAVETVFTVEDRDEALSPAVRLALARGAEKILVSAAVLAKMAYRENPGPWLAVVRENRRTLARIRLPENPLVVLCCGLEKPGNLGAILRSAEAAGADLVAVDRAGADLFGPNVVRSSTGACFLMPVVSAAPQELLAWVQTAGLRLLASSPVAETAYDSLDWRGGVALAIGAEDRGLDDFWLQAADQSFCIPMRGRVDSLNASAAAAVLLFEAARHRPAADRTL